MSHEADPLNMNYKKTHLNPTEVTLDRIGGKWKTAILCLLAEQGALRNGEIMRILSPITQKMLTQQLRELEEDGFIGRTVYAEVPPKVIYELTDSGWSLKTVLDPLCEWGRRFVNAVKQEDASNSSRKRNKSD